MWHVSQVRNGLCYVYCMSQYENLDFETACSKLNAEKNRTSTLHPNIISWFDSTLTMTANFIWRLFKENRMDDDPAWQPQPRAWSDDTYCHLYPLWRMKSCEPSLCVSRLKENHAKFPAGTAFVSVTVPQTCNVDHCSSERVNIRSTTSARLFVLRYPQCSSEIDGKVEEIAKWAWTHATSEPRVLWIVQTGSELEYYWSGAAW